MAQCEEKRLKVSNKAIEILKFLDRDVTNKYFKGNHHAIEATEALQENLMEILDYQQDLSKQGHQAILTAYYDAQSTSHQITAVKADIDVQASLARQEMVSKLHSGQFVSSIAQDTQELQKYYDDYGGTSSSYRTVRTPELPAVPTPAGVTSVQMCNLSSRLADVARYAIHSTPMTDYGNMNRCGFTETVGECALHKDVRANYLVTKLDRQYGCRAKVIHAFTEAPPVQRNIQNKELHYANITTAREIPASRDNVTNENSQTAFNSEEMSEAHAEPTAINVTVDTP